MLNRLSAKYQKETALGFISIFFITGLGSLKAQVVYSAAYQLDNLSHKNYTLINDPAIIFSSHKNKELKYFRNNSFSDPVKMPVNRYTQKSLNLFKDSDR